MAVTHGGQEAGLTTRPPLRLSRLLAPLDIADFKQNYWEKEPLIVHREEPEYYSDPLTLRDVDHILSTSSVRSSELKVVVNGRELPLVEMATSGPGGPANALEVLYDLYRKGS